MKWIRCDDCGMAVKVNEDEIFVKCPICNKSLNTFTADTVRGFDNMYNSQNYCICEEEKKVEEKDEEMDLMELLKNSPFGSSDSEQKAPPALIFIIIVIFIFISFIASIFGG